MTIIDNLDNAFQIAYERMQKLAGGNAKNMKFIKVSVPVLPRCTQRCRPNTIDTLQGDLRHFDEVDKLFAAEK